MRTGKAFTATAAAFVLCIFVSACPRVPKDAARQETEKEGAEQNEAIPFSNRENSAASAAAAGLDAKGGARAAVPALSGGPASAAPDANAAMTGAADTDADKAFTEEAAAHSESAEEKILDQNARKKLSGAADASGEAEAAMNALFGGE